MIYTCTMNLAIDLFIKTQDLVPSVVNRTQEADYQPNGKGVNVSFILKKLGLDSTALGFSAGFTGRFISDQLLAAGIQTAFIPIPGINRINVFTRVTSQNIEYKLVNQGPSLSPDHIQQLLAQIKKLKPQDTLVISGSHPQGVTDDTYLAIAQAAQAQGFQLILDISSPVVLDLLPYGPALIKPNDEELAHWFQEDALNQDQLIYYGRQLLAKGARQVLLSLGPDGALLLTPEITLKATAPQGQVVNTACAGDTLLATFIGCRQQGLSYEDSLVKAVAAGSSTAFRPGLTDFSDVAELSKSIELTYL